MLPQALLALGGGVAGALLYDVGKPKIKALLGSSSTPAALPPAAASPATPAAPAAPAKPGDKPKGTSGADDLGKGFSYARSMPRVTIARRPPRHHHRAPPQDYGDDQDDQDDQDDDLDGAPAVVPRVFLLSAASPAGAPAAAPPASGVAASPRGAANGCKASGKCGTPTIPTLRIIIAKEHELEAPKAEPKPAAKVPEAKTPATPAKGEAEEELEGTGNVLEETIFKVGKGVVAGGLNVIAPGAGTLVAQGAELAKQGVQKTTGDTPEQQAARAKAQQAAQQQAAARAGMHGGAGEMNMGAIDPFTVAGPPPVLGNFFTRSGINWVATPAQRQRFYAASRAWQARLKRGVANRLTVVGPKLRACYQQVAALRQQLATVPEDQSAQFPAQDVPDVPSDDDDTSGLEGEGLEGLGGVEEGADMGEAADMGAATGNQLLRNRQNFLSKQKRQLANCLRLSTRYVRSIHYMSRRQVALTNRLQQVLASAQQDDSDDDFSGDMGMTPKQLTTANKNLATTIGRMKVRIRRCVKALGWQKRTYATLQRRIQALLNRIGQAQQQVQQMPVPDYTGPDLDDTDDDDDDSDDDDDDDFSGVLAGLEEGAGTADLDGDDDTGDVDGDDFGATRRKKHKHHKGHHKAHQMTRAAYVGALKRKLAHCKHSNQELAHALRLVIAEAGSIFALEDAEFVHQLERAGRLFSSPFDDGTGDVDGDLDGDDGTGDVDGDLDGDDMGGRHVRRARARRGGKRGGKRGGMHGTEDVGNDVGDTEGDDTTGDVDGELDGEDLGYHHGAHHGLWDRPRGPAWGYSITRPYDFSDAEIEAYLGGDDMAGPAESGIGGCVPCGTVAVGELEGEDFAGDIGLDGEDGTGTDDD